VPLEQRLAAHPSSGLGVVSVSGRMRSPRPGREDDALHRAAPASAVPRCTAWRSTMARREGGGQRGQQRVRTRRVVGAEVAHVDVERRRAELGPGVHGQVRLGEQHDAGHAARRGEAMEQLADRVQSARATAARQQCAARRRRSSRARAVASAEVGGEVQSVHGARISRGP
jgi:hypothetical protein